MRTSPTYVGRSVIKQGLKMALAVLLLVASVGCQSQRKTQEYQAQMQEAMDNNTEKLLSQIKQLQEDQQQMTEDVESIREDCKRIKMDQLTIGTKVAGAQRQLASQVLETTQAIQQEQAELKTTLQDTNTQFTQQLEVLAGKQHDLEKTTKTIYANGQILCTSHDQVLLHLTELKQGYQHWQDELTLMQEKVAALGTSILDVQAGLGQFESSLAKDIKGLTDNLASKRAAEQDMAEQLTTLTRKLTEMAVPPKRQVTLFPDFDRPAKVQKKTYSKASAFEMPEKPQLSKSSQADVEMTPVPEP